MPIIDIGGVQGAGKSTLIENARLLTKNEFRVIKRSVILAQILGVPLGKENLVGAEELQEARQKMWGIVANEDNCVRDAHFSRYFPEPEIYPIGASDHGRVSAIVLVQASLEALIERRTSTERERPTDPSTIIKQVELEERAARLAAGHLEVPLISIVNNDLDVATRALANVIDQYLPLPS